ncbi:MAG: regulatory protein ArsR [Acidobacteria bacterium]|nr:regulatory protein ArsR [Acidobacteriota bacterium]
MKSCIIRGVKQKPVDMELFFLALADRTRLRLLSLIGEDEVCVCFFVEVLKTNQPKISRHLAYLRKAGLVSARRQGKWMHYRITRPHEIHAQRIFEQVMTWLRDDNEMRKDRERLVSLCCSPRPPVLIQGAPRPARVVT